MYINLTLNKFLDDLADKLPAPGGGSAAALSAASAAALVEMVCNFTMGNNKYEQYFQKVKKIFQQTQEIRKKISSLIDEDINAYQNAADALKLPKPDPRRREQLEHCLKIAANVPADVCRYCSDIAKLCDELLPVANVNLISDIGVAIVLAQAAFDSAILNVDINLAYIKDQEFIEKMKKEIYPRQSKINKLKDKIYGQVKVMLKRR